MSDIPSPTGTAADPRGLSTTEATRRLVEHGPNAVTTRREETFWDELLESLREPLVMLLLAVGVLYFVFGEVRDALIVLGVIVTVAITEAAVEWRAGRAISALAALAEPKALLWRDGQLAEHPVERLVPGDLIELRAGSRVPADVRLVTAQDVAVDESLVTGESNPVPHDLQAPELLAGTLVVRGAGRAEVTRTGAQSTLGKIAELVAATREPKTPMQRRMAELARTLLWVAIAVSVIIPLIGIAAGQPPLEMLLTGLSLAFATIPEELAVLIVVVLGIGSLKLARRGAIVRQLRAAETLGAVTTICTDKTGTLTLNRMTLDKAISAAALLGSDDAADDGLRRAAALASEPEEGGTFIDPMDAAIREAAPKVVGGGQFPFDQARRLASGYGKVDGAYLIGVKGAPEAVLAHCSTHRTASGTEALDDAKRTALLASAAALGEGGRVLGVASRSADALPASRDAAESGLVFEGVVVLRDPVRPEVVPAMEALRGAGVGVTVITGDQPTTAARIAEEAGIEVRHQFLGSDLAALDDTALAETLRDGAVIARAQPEDKLRIVEALTSAGGVVMVTGDGVNDAPALRAASVGVAMGHVGSDAARQAAGVVLTDDSFSTIVEAVQEGRRLFDNFRKAIRFYLAVKLALILISAVAAILRLPLPFAPVQIVILELFMDLGAALAFVGQPADSNVLSRPPRDPNAPFFDRSMVSAIVAGAVTLAAIVLGAFLLNVAQDGLAGARTLALVAWFVGHAALGFVMAFDDGRPRLAAVFSNPALGAWLAASVLFAAALVFVPPLADAIGAGGAVIASAVGWGAVAVVLPFWMVVWLRFINRDSGSAVMPAEP
ncbi:MAG: cation-transporting P-type ATPase [Devosia sp.]|nr:cation-transporting P-type ATPase [Devosia sp.]